MSLWKIFRRGLTILFIHTCLLTAAIVVAAVQIFDGEGKYIMSDFESHDIAKQRAQQRAERNAQKKAGVYLKDFSRTVNAVITEDEISAVTNNIIKVTDVKIVPVPFETNGETGIMYRATLKASIDPEGIYDYIKRDNKEKVTIVQQNDDLQDAIQKNEKLIEDLKEQYKRATSQTEKERILKQMNEADRDFLANQKFEEAKRLVYLEGLSPREATVKEVLELLTEAIKLNPHYADAYFNRGLCYACLEEYYQAIQDFDKAIELKPNANSYFYFYRAMIYSDEMKNYAAAIADLTKAIKLNYSDPDFYWFRGDFYFELENYGAAIADYTKIIELNLDDVEWSYKARAELYEKMKNYTAAIADYTTIIKLNPTDADYYYSRGLCYQQLGETAKAQADFAKAKELGYKD